MALSSFLSTADLSFLTSADPESGSYLVRLTPTTAGGYTNGIINLSGVSGAGNVAIGNVLDPVAAQDAATKNYVDSIAGAGVTWKNAAQAATTGDLATATYTAPNTITFVGLPAANAIDGVTLTINDRVLVKNGVAGSGTPAVSNGIYYVTTTSPNMIITRTTDATTNTQASGAAIFAFAGTVNGDRAFVCTSNDGATDFNPVNFGTSIEFSQFSIIGTAPAAPDTSVQYNDASSFGGTVAFTFNKSSATPVLSVGNDAVSTTATLNVSTGSSQTTGVLNVAATATATSATTATFNLGAATTTNTTSTINLSDGTGTTTISAQSTGLFLIQGSEDKTPVTLNAGNATTAGAGGALSLNAGDGNGAGAGGALTATSGDAGTTGNGGLISLTTGAATTGNGGGLTLLAGNSATSGNGGVISLTAGNATTSGSAGTVTITAGNSASAAGGAVDINGGTGGGATAGGAVTLDAGQGGATGAGGVVALAGGAGGATSGAGGAVTVIAGSATAGTSNGGAISLTTGSPTAAGAAGNFTVTAANAVATAASTPGTVTITAGSSNTTASTAGGLVSISSGAGGDNDAGGLFDINTGNGGAVGGAGGQLDIDTGTGGNNTGATGGAGGSVTLDTGAGGTETTGTGGAGGIITITGGAGGLASGAAGIGGLGSVITITGGAGGATTNATGGNAGNGGSITMISGAGALATNAGASDGLGGSVYISVGENERLPVNADNNFGKIIFTLGSPATGGSALPNANIVLFQGFGGSNDGRQGSNSEFLSRLEDDGRWFSTAYMTVSDAQFKTNIEQLNDSLSYIKKLEGYKYNWKDELNGPKEYGMIAQQVESAGLKDLVHDDGGSKFVNYQSFIPFLVEGIKELSKQVDDLKSQLNSDKNLDSRLSPKTLKIPKTRLRKDTSL